MSNQPEGSGENPLDDFAAKLSQTLGNQPVEIKESATGRVEGGQVWMRESAARSVHANALHLENSAAAFVRAHAVDANESALAVTAAREVSLTNGNAAVVITQNAKATDVRTFVLLAARVNGTVSTVITPLTAFLAGAGLGVALFALKRIVAGLSARKSVLRSTPKK